MLDGSKQAAVLAMLHAALLAAAAMSWSCRPTHHSADTPAVSAQQPSEPHCAEASLAGFCPGMSEQAARKVLPRDLKQGWDPERGTTLNVEAVRICDQPEILGDLSLQLIDGRVRQVEILLGSDPRMLEALFDERWGEGDAFEFTTSGELEGEDGKLYCRAGGLEVFKTWKLPCGIDADFWYAVRRPGERVDSYPGPARMTLSTTSR